MGSHIDGAAIRAARIEAGLTQHELARKVGAAGGERISRWERGTSEPRPQFLRRLSEVLNLPLNDLIVVQGVPDLRGLRPRAGLAADDVAHHAKLTVPTLLRWENGAGARMPAQSTVEDLADIFGVSPTAILAAIRQARDDRGTTGR